MSETEEPGREEEAPENWVEAFKNAENPLELRALSALYGETGPAPPAERPPADIIRIIDTSQPDIIRIIDTSQQPPPEGTPADIVRIVDTSQEPPEPPPQGPDDSVDAPAPEEPPGPPEPPADESEEPVNLEEVPNGDIAILGDGSGGGGPEPPEPPTPGGEEPDPGKEYVGEFRGALLGKIQDYIKTGPGKALLEEAIGPLLEKKIASVYAEKFNELLDLDKIADDVYEKFKEKVEKTLEEKVASAVRDAMEGKIEEKIAEKVREYFETNPPSGQPIDEKALFDRLYTELKTKFQGYLETAEANIKTELTEDMSTKLAAPREGVEESIKADLKTEVPDEVERYLDDNPLKLRPEQLAGLKEGLYQDEGIIEGLYDKLEPKLLEGLKEHIQQELATAKRAVRDGLDRELARDLEELERTLQRNMTDQLIERTEAIREALPGTFERYLTNNLQAKLERYLRDNPNVLGGYLENSPALRTAADRAVQDVLGEDIERRFTEYSRSGAYQTLVGNYTEAKVQNLLGEGAFDNAIEFRAQELLTTPGPVRARIDAIVRQTVQRTGEDNIRELAREVLGGYRGSDEQADDVIVAIRSKRGDFDGEVHASMNRKKGRWVAPAAIGTAITALLVSAATLIYRCGGAPVPPTGPTAVVKQIEGSVFPADYRLEIYRADRRVIGKDEGVMLYLERVPWSGPGDGERYAFFVKNPAKSYETGKRITVPLSDSVGVRGVRFGDRMDYWEVPDSSIDLTR